MKLAIYIEDEIKHLYCKELNQTTDSGFDLFVPETIVVPPHSTIKINHKVKCEVKGEPQGYFLIPRSSISNTPLCCHNSIGVIDFEYRGYIKAAVYNGSNEDYTIEAGKRLFQLCSPDLKPLEIELVDSVSETKRNEGGFGSTGN